MKGENGKLFKLKNGRRSNRELNNKLRRETDKAREDWWRVQCEELEEMDQTLCMPQCEIHYYIILYYVILYCIVLYCIVLYCIVLYCIALHCIALHCIALH